MFGSGKIDNENIRAIAEQAKFEVRTHSKNSSNKEKKVDVIFWDHAARELKDPCSNFICLNEHLEMMKPRVREGQEGIFQTA